MTDLKPSKFGVTSKGPKDLSPNTKPDRFGQVNSADKDFSAGGAPSAKEIANFHLRADVDASHRALHHTLGNGRNQAAPGDHVHDGIRGNKIGLYEMDPANPGRTRPSLVLSGAKGGNVALTNLIAFLKNFIDFRDTTT